MRRQTRYHLRRLLRRTLLFILLPAALLLALRLIWGYEAAHRLQNVRAQIKAAGILTDIADFPDGAAIPRDQNGIYDFLAALKLFPRLSAAQAEAIELDDRDVHPGVFFEETPTIPEAVEIQKILEASKPVLALIDSAGARPRMVMPRDILHELLTDWSKERDIDNGARILGNLCYCAAVAAQARGDEVEVLRNVRRMLTLSRGVDQCPQAQLHMSAVALREFTSEALERLEPKISLKDPPAAAEARLLLIEFRNDQELSGGLVRSASSSLVWDVQYLSSDFAHWRAWWVHPLFDEQVARMSLDAASYLPALQARNLPQIRALFPSTSYDRETHLDQIIHKLEDETGVGWAQPLKWQLRALAYSRAASLLLAARLYSAKTGSLPKIAADLVPDFLTSIPLDPFANGQPLHYRPDPGGPTVWRFSDDGVDQGCIVYFNAEGKKSRYKNSSDQPDPAIVYGAAWRDAVPPAPTTPK